MKVAVIGYGGRGTIYAQSFKELGAEITAVCDTNLNRLDLVAQRFSEAERFSSDDKFFSRGKLADICVISTQDALHIVHAVKAMEAGYDLLLEKPIAVSEQDCAIIASTALRLKKKVFVCHVLRYAPFFAEIKKQLDTGAYGKVATVNLTENVGYWHYVHSYVRGNWSNSVKASPMILAKSCHDLDILNWLIGSRCNTVSSFGSLMHFNRQNAPKGCAKRCTECTYQDSCEFSAVRLYLDLNHKPFALRTGGQGWPGNTLVDTYNENELIKALKTGDYGLCVYHADNDVVDHQVVNMLYDNGATAHLTMTAFSRDCYRAIHIHAERGEIFGDMDNNLIRCQFFHGHEHIIDLNGGLYDTFGHGGGDYLMVKDVFNAYTKRESAAGLTSIDVSMSSHFMAFAAEKSRLAKGAAITITNSTI